jgi:hypothetical protein
MALVSFGTFNKKGLKVFVWGTGRGSKGIFICDSYELWVFVSGQLEIRKKV